MENKTGVMDLAKDLVNEETKYQIQKIVGKHAKYKKEEMEDLLLEAMIGKEECDKILDIVESEEITAAIRGIKDEFNKKEIDMHNNIICIDKVIDQLGYEKDINKIVFTVSKNGIKAGVYLKEDKYILTKGSTLINPYENPYISGKHEDKNIVKEYNRIKGNIENKLGVYTVIKDTTIKGSYMSKIVTGKAEHRIGCTWKNNRGIRLSEYR